MLALYIILFTLIKSYYNDNLTSTESIIILTIAVNTCTTITSAH
jgi:hypothetical protein